MKFIDSLKTAWKTTPTSTKIKIAVEAVCDIGATILMAAVGSKFCNENDGKLKRFAVNTTLTGLGMYAAAQSSQQINSLVDAVYSAGKTEQTEPNEAAEDDEDA